MITRITTVNQLKQMFLEIFLNKTDKVTDISKESVLNAVAYGCAKVGQKCLVNQAVIEAHLFPDSAYGTYLDDIAERSGVTKRYIANGSSTFLRIMGDPNTYYQKEELTFVSTSGISFILENSFYMPDSGYVYAKVKSQDVGMKTNVDPISINRLTTNVQGHIACTNEYRATGGMDSESDEMFRIRIKENVNRLSRGTLSYLEQILISINQEVLRVHKGGMDSDGKINLIVVSTSGRDFSDDEFNEMLTKSEQYLSLTELMNETTDFKLKLKNVDWLYVDVDFRANLDPSMDVDVIRRNMQIQVSKLFDYRFWKYGDVVEWENILFAIKNIEGVRYIPDVYFSPHSDSNVQKYKLPRIRGFVMRDLNGNIISDNYYVLDNFFYPNMPDYSFVNSVTTII